MSLYGSADDLVHPTDGNPLWQDSHWFMWRDANRGVSGLHRFGLHPQMGTATFWCGVMTDDGRRYRNQGWRIPMPEQPGAAFVVTAGQRLEFTDDDDPAGQGVRILVDEPDCKVDLRYRNHFPMVRYLDDGRVPTAGAPDHYEASGSVTGTVRLGEDESVIDAVAFRDRSWGARDYAVALSHRWVAGTFGPDLSFSATAVAARDGSYFTDAIVIEGGAVHRAETVDIVVHLEGDSFTHRGGTVALVLPGGREMRLDIETIDATMFTIGDDDVYVEIDSICRVHHEGRVGFCDLEAAFNARRGWQLPVLALRANMTLGLSRR
jgi:hypothetical protein